MTQIRDPSGEALYPTVLRVTAMDEQRRPTICRVLYDDEKLTLPDDVGENQFLTVWSPRERLLGTDALSLIMRQADELMASIASSKVEIAEAMNLTRSVSAERDRLAAECTRKTEALRELQRFRDPSRVELLVAGRVSMATANLEARLAAQQRVIVDKDCEIAELKIAKRRLREALDRLK